MPVYNVHELEVNTVLVPTLYYTLYWLVPTLCCTVHCTGTNLILYSICTAGWYQPYTVTCTGINRVL